MTGPIFSWYCYCEHRNSEISEGAHFSPYPTSGETFMWPRYTLRPSGHWWTPGLWESTSDTILCKCAYQSDETLLVMITIPITHRELCKTMPVVWTVPDGLSCLPSAHACVAMFICRILRGFWHCPYKQCPMDLAVLLGKTCVAIYIVI